MRCCCVNRDYKTNACGMTRLLLFVVVLLLLLLPLPPPLLRERREADKRAKAAMQPDLLGSSHLAAM